jgi:hypothetical protein
LEEKFREKRTKSMNLQREKETGCGLVVGGRWKRMRENRETNLI